MRLLPAIVIARTFWRPFPPSRRLRRLPLGVRVESLRGSPEHARGAHLRHQRGRRRGGSSGEPLAVTFFGENGPRRRWMAPPTATGMIRANPGNDDIYGERGADYLDGGDDNDTILGGLGDDTIRERRFGVNEHLYGGAGNDIVAGGRGGDFAIVQRGAQGNDVVEDRGLGQRPPLRRPGDEHALRGGEGYESRHLRLPARQRHGLPRPTLVERRPLPARQTPRSESAGCEHVVDPWIHGAFPMRRGDLGHNGNDTWLAGRKRLRRGEGRQRPAVRRRWPGRLGDGATPGSDR